MVTEVDPVVEGQGKGVGVSAIPGKTPVYEQRWVSDLA